MHFDEARSYRTVGIAIRYRMFSTIFKARFVKAVICFCCLTHSSASIMLFLVTANEWPAPSKDFTCT